MRIYKFSENAYTSAVERLARQLVAMAQEDAESERNSTEWCEEVEDYSESYTQDAINDIESAVTKILRTLDGSA